MYPYRVFISYSHADAAMAERLRAHIAGLGARPMADVEFVAGVPFDSEIMDRIAHAHVFLPVLTDDSSSRPWVHQEIGYAMGLRVPILPIAIGALPQGLVERLHALAIAPDLRDLSERFTARRFDDVIARSRSGIGAIYECADNPDRRTEMLVDYASRVLHHGYGRVKQMSAFTSFSIPDARAGSSIWGDREGALHAGENTRTLLRHERQCFEQHARDKGCDLIIKPSVRAERHGVKGSITRLTLLREFLASMTDASCRVAIHSDPLQGNLTIVDDWFVADAVVPYGQGSYHKTMFTRHAPTVLDRVAEFDRLMDDLIGEMNLGKRSSRQAAIDVLDTELENLR